MHKTKDFDYDLPDGYIAQHPLDKRDASKLMVLNRQDKAINHYYFYELPQFLEKGDVLVVNDSRVFPARLFGQKVDTGGKVELLLLENLDEQHWRVMVGGKRCYEGVKIGIKDREGRETGLTAVITEVLEGSQREICLNQPIDALLDILGHTPLPPYIHESLADPERYQTIYSRSVGSAAAPTAGLHFTSNLLLSLREAGVHIETVTLHIGLDTFKPVDVDDVAEHTIHSEWATLTTDSARRINETKLAGGRIIAVGTTTVRVLETAALHSAGITANLNDISLRDTVGETYNACPWRPVAAFEGRTDLYIYPGYRFRAVDALITNFHLPQSTLLMLVSAFAGRETVLDAYREAIEHNYRFYSFGDAMFIL